MSRLFIDKGWLIQDRELFDDDAYPIIDKKGDPYIALLAFQVYEENGQPATRNYVGPGEIHGNKIFLGDPQRTTNLIEGRIDRSPSGESNDHFSGYKLAVTVKRPLTEKQFLNESYGRSQLFIDGYREGQRDRKKRGIKR